MSREVKDVEIDQFEVALVLPESKMLLAFHGTEGYRLPVVEVRRWGRTAEQLQQRLVAAFGIRTIMIEFLPASVNADVCAVAVVLGLETFGLLERVSIEEISMLEVRQRSALELILQQRAPSGSPFSSLGWIDEAILWVEGATASRLASRSSIVQYNAGGGFCLLSFRMVDGACYWMKATAYPNGHEAEVTRYLAGLADGYLPEIMATRDDWNAWLMRGDGGPFPKDGADPNRILAALESAVTSMARLQMQTMEKDEELLHAGAFDQRNCVLLEALTGLFDYVTESMSLQTSTNVPRLSAQRVQEIRSALEACYLRMERLGIPSTIVHGDLNAGNILTMQDRCQFIDWAEAYVGNPFVSLQGLLLLSREPNAQAHRFIQDSLRNRYIEEWSRLRSPEALREALALTPLSALASTLYGRGDWLGIEVLRDDARRRSFTRSLVRRMDRALHAPEFEEIAWV